MIDLGQETGVVDVKQLLALSKDKLKAAIEKHIDQDIEPEKVEQYRKARRNDFYYRGIFDIAPTRISDQVVDYTQIGIPVSSDPRKTRELNYNFNITRGDFMKAIAVLGSKAPDCSAVPDDADDEDSYDVARRADLVDQKIARSVDLNEIQAELTLDLCTTTTTFIYTPWVVDGGKYGETSEPKLEEEQVPWGDPSYKCVHCGTETPVDEGTETGMCASPGCGKPLGAEDLQEPQKVTLPSEQGTEDFANGGVEWYIKNIFSVSTPFFARKLKDAEWLRLEEEITPSQGMEIFPDISKELLERGENSETSGFGQQVRAQVSSESGIRRHRENTVRFTRYWLRPSFLNNLRDDKVTVEETGNQEQSLRDLLRNRFHRGVRITMINGEIQDLFEESMDDVWVACKPSVSKYLYCDPLCHDSIPFQELTNRLGNIGVQTLLRAIPVTLMDSDLLDREALKNREQIVAEVLPIKRRTGQAISDSMGQLPQAKFSDQQMPFMAGMQELRQDINGIRPELSGGGAVLPTAHQTETRKQQALMQLRITYNNTRWAMAKARENAVRQYARYAPGQMKAEPTPGVLGPEAGQMVQIADLVDGKFHFEPDDGMARTFEDERQDFKDMTTGQTAAPPALLTAVGLDSPVNLPRVQKYFGAAGWYYPGKDERTKLRKILRRLLAEAPQQGPDGSPAPTVQLDPWDDPKLLGMLMAAWFNSDAGTSERESNPNGFQNALAYWQECQKAANPPPQPAAKLTFTRSLDKTPPDEASEIEQQFGINAKPGQLPVPAPPQKTTGGAGTPRPQPGPQGIEVPEPAQPIPQPAEPIPNA